MQPNQVAQEMLFHSESTLSNIMQTFSAQTRESIGSLIYMPSVQASLEVLGNVLGQVISKSLNILVKPKTCMKYVSCCHQMTEIILKTV